MALARSLALEIKDSIDGLTSSFETIQSGKLHYVPPVIVVAKKSFVKTKNERQSYQVLP